MKIRTVENLVELIQEDLSWRKKELSYLLSEVNTAKIGNKDTTIRSALVLLYAHWEGFVKNAVEYYLTYVISLKLRFDELEICFVARSLKRKIFDFEESNKSSIHSQFINYIFYNMDERAILTNTVNTQSNLNSETFKEILIDIGIDYSPYSMKANLIDEQLLKYRNNIAHGHNPLLDAQDYKILHQEILIMIDSINNDIQNAAITNSFRRKVR